MSVWDKARRFFKLSDDADEEELSLDDKKLLEALGINIDQLNVKGKNALRVEVVYACIRILSDSVSKLPLKIFEEDEHGVASVVKHPVHRLLKLRPNPYMSASDFWKAIEANRALGNAYASLEFDNRGNIVGVWPIDSSRVKLMVDNANYISNGIRSHQQIWYEVNTGSEIVKVFPDEMLHFKGSITLDGLVGVNTVDYLLSSIENAGASSAFVNNFFKQGLQTRGIVEYTGDLDDKAERTFRKKFEQMSSGLKNSHRISLLPVGYRFTPINMSMTDPQFLENTELNIRQIANGFGVKMHQLNDLSRSTHSNISEQNRGFYVDTLQSILTTYEQELTYKGLLDSEIERGMFFRFNVDAILRSDIKTRYEAYRTGIQSGLLKINEARRSEDLPPVEGGDRLLVNGTMIPIEDAGKAYMKGGEKNEPKEDDEESERNPSALDPVGSEEE